MRQLFLAILLGLFFIVAASHSSNAQSPDIIYLGDIPGGSTYSIALGISSDGTAVVGASADAFGLESFYWSSGSGMINLGDFAGGAVTSNATGVSADGSMIVGFGHNGNYASYSWTSGTGMVNMGDLPGGSSFSRANDVNADGSVIVGRSNSVNGNEAYRWTSGGGMVGLGDLAGGAYFSSALDVSDDGTIVVGRGSSASGIEAFRWTSGTGMVGLGDLAGGSFASVANAISGDGEVIVGYGNTALGQAAMIWDQINGMRELAIVLTDLGVDLTGWTLNTATGISDDQEHISGTGNYLGNTSAFLAILTNSISGVTTVDALAESLGEAQVSHQQAISQNGTYTSRGLFLARNALSYFPKVVAPQQKVQSLSLPSRIEPAAGDDGETYLSYDQGYFSPEKWAFYSLGSFAMGQENNPDSHSLDGSAGVLYRADQNWIVGGGMISGQSRIDLGNGGTNILDSYGGEILSSYRAPNGVQIYVIGFASYLTLDSSRGYMNGGGRSYSYGESDGYGYGASARLGYEMDVLPERGMTVMPYIEAEYSKTKIDSYDEKHGPFPASYSDQNGERVIGRVGLEVSHDIGERVTVRGRAAYAERLHDAEEDVTASSMGLTMTLSPNKVDDRWGEGGVTVLWRAADNLNLSADVSGRTGKTEDPYARATVGVTLGF